MNGQPSGIILDMADKGLRDPRAALHPAEAIHHVVQRIELRRILAGMRETGSTLARFRRRDIDVMRGPEVLRLRALLHFEIEKRKFASTAQPRVIGEQRHGTVVRVGVNRPMGEHQAGMLNFNQLRKLLVALSIDLRAAVDLAGKHRPGLEDPTRALAFGGAYCRSFVMRLPGDTRFASRQVKNDNLTSEVRVAGDGASAARFRVVRMAACHHDFQPRRSCGVLVFRPQQGQAHGCCTCEFTGLADTAECRASGYSLHRIDLGGDLAVGQSAYCSMSRDRACVTAPATSGPAEFTSPYQRSFLFLSHGGTLSHSALGMM